MFYNCAHMAWLQNRKIWLWLLSALVLIPLLGLFLRAQQIRAALQRADRTAQSEGASEAARDLADAAARLPAAGELWREAAKYALEAGEPEQVVQYLQQPGLQQLGAEERRLWGEALWQMEDLQGAAEQWRAALELEGGSEETLKKLLAVDLALMDLEAARKDLEVLIAHKPEDMELYYQLGLVLAASEPQSAISPLKKVIESGGDLAGRAEDLRRRITSGSLDQEPASLFMAAGRGLARLDEWSLAEEAFRQATRLQPAFAEAWAYLGEARQHTATDSPLDREAGREELEKALQLNPESVAAHTFLALYWQRHGDADQAAAALEDAIRLDPENPALHAELGSALARGGDLSSAADAYRRAADLSHSEVEYLRMLAEFSIRYDYQVETLGLEAARQAVISRPEDPAALDTMAQVLVKLNDLTSAERFLNRALQADPNFAPALAHLGLVYLFAGNMESARAELLRARELDPDGPAGMQADRFLQRYWPSEPTGE